MINKRIYTLIGIILIIILCLIGCNGSKGENPESQNSTDLAKIKEFPKKTENQKTPNFEEALLALELYPYEPEAQYDTGTPVLLRVELFSPRASAILNHNQYFTNVEEKLALPKVMAENLAQPWWQSLKLTFTSSNGTSGELQFQTYYFQTEDVLDLGKGGVGSLELIISENSFPQAGKYNLKAIWQSNKYGLIESDNLPITLIKDHLSDADRNLLRVKVLLATKKNAPALQLLTNLVKDNPNSYEVRYYLAEALEKNNNLNEALTQYQTALTLFPEEKPGEPLEPPVGLYIKIRKLMEKLGKK